MADETAFHVFAITSSLMVPGQLPATPCSAFFDLDSTTDSGPEKPRHSVLEIGCDADHKKSATWGSERGVVSFFGSGVEERVCKPGSCCVQG
jgi:hypothetical protein